jgi:hypothetical protein
LPGRPARPSHAETARRVRHPDAPARRPRRALLRAVLGLRLADHDATTHLLLPYILAAQAQKHVTHNEALRLLDGLVQLSVLDRDLTAPPASPADSDQYIVGSGATGDWAGWDLNVALWTDGAWLRLPTRTGWRAWAEDEGLLVCTGTARTAPLLAELQNLTRIGIGTAASGSDVLSVAGTNALFASSRSFGLKISKQASADDAALAFQIGLSTRALIGLLGSDDLGITVSPDGTTYHQALVIDRSSARIRLPRHPKFSGYCNYDQSGPASTWFRVDINIARHNDQAALLAGGVFKAPHEGIYQFGGAILLKTSGTAPTQISLGLAVNGAIPNQDTWGRAGEGSAALDDNS